jgi:hypothetical protein
MYPERELKELALLRMARIRLIEERRKASCESIRWSMAPLGLLNSAVVLWHGTRFPASLLIVFLGSLDRPRDQPRWERMRGVLRGTLFVLSLARRADQSLVQKPDRDHS